MTILYGIPNCDTIKKAKKWLENHQVDYQFHDYRKQGVTRDMLVTFEQALGWESLLNKRGTTFRQLSETDKQNIDKEKAIELMIQYPAMIKRPVLEHQNQYTLGFKDPQYQAFFGK